MSLDGKKFVLTGDFDDLSHDDLNDNLEGLGASVTNKINRAVDAVLAGQKADGDLIKKARAYGIPILRRWQYDGLLKGHSLNEMAELGDEAEDREFDKGRTVKVVSGPEAVGMIGEIFWWGPSKFGEGMRAGIDGVDGEKYWIDEKHLGWPDEEIKSKDEQPLGKGSKVKVVGGDHQGESGTIFWWGKSKYGAGMRAGVKTAEDATLWVDEGDLERK